VAALRDRRLVLVTGGMGQVGSYIVERLSMSMEYAVVVLDNFSSNAVNKLPGSVEVVRGDIRDTEVLNKLVKKVDIIIHAAAQVNVVKSLLDPRYDLEVNILGTLDLLEAARNSNIFRFVYFSSAAVYGMPRYLPIDEEHPKNPISPYGVSKLAGEQYCQVFNKVYGLPTVCVRPFNIYSRRQNPSNPYSGVIAKFIGRVKAGKPPVIEGDGTQTRDFICVHDVVDFILLAMEKKEAIGEIYNIGTGRETSIQALANEIIEIAGANLKPVYTKPRKGDIKRGYADIKKAKKLGFKPKVNLRDGLKELMMQKE
jgi:UDP-glucose 4-epimerase